MLPQLLAAALCLAPARAQLVSTAALQAQIPFFLPQNLQGQQAPDAVQAVGTPNVVSATAAAGAAAAAATGYDGTYVVNWAANANSLALTVSSNPSTLIATQTLANNGGSNAWNCALNQAAAQAVCSVVYAAVGQVAPAGNGYAETEQLVPFTTLANVAVAELTTVPLPTTTSAAAPATSAAPTTTSLSFTQSTPVAISTPSQSNTSQSKSANVFAPSGGAVSNARLELALALLVGTLLGAVILL